MQGIIKQLEACHEHFKAMKRDGEGLVFEEWEANFESALSIHRALIDRLKAIPTWHMSVDEMAAMTPEGE